MRCMYLTPITLFYIFLFLSCLITLFLFLSHPISLSLYITYLNVSVAKTELVKPVWETGVT